MNDTTQPDVSIPPETPISSCSWRWLRLGLPVLVPLVFIVIFGNRMVARNLVSNPGFESGISSWRTHDDSGAVDVTAETGHSGRHAIVSTRRTASWSGPEHSLLGRLRPGRTYTCSGWVKVQNGDEEPVKLTIRQRDAS